MKQLTFITGNSNKVKQLELYLKFPVEYRAIDLPEIQDLNVETVAVAKAQAAYDIHKAPVLIEDIGLAFNALGGLPGPFVKWFLETVGNEGMCRMLDSYQDRTAIGTVCYVLCDEHGHHVFTATREGTIAMNPRGPTEFGWNPIFIPAGETSTYAEMSSEAQQATSLRRTAIALLQAYLDANYQ
jgi:non-canonical purine NTP pyrophosphatase (RdgB/HAM1 family)